MSEYAWHAHALGACSCPVGWQQAHGAVGERGDTKRHRERTCASGGYVTAGRSHGCRRVPRSRCSGGLSARFGHGPRRGCRPLGSRPVLEAAPPAGGAPSRRLCPRRASRAPLWSAEGRGAAARWQRHRRLRNLLRRSGSPPPPPGRACRWAGCRRTSTGASGPRTWGRGNHGREVLAVRLWCGQVAWGQHVRVGARRRVYVRWQHL